MTTIRSFETADWPAVWRFMEPVIRAGETYPYALDLTAEQAHHMWVGVTDSVYVAELKDNKVVGSYYIKANQPSLGAHVANCGYMVSEQARGKGVATEMCVHSQVEAIRLGYRAMQFNLVVSTNHASVHLWRKLGFDIVGTLWGAFSHKQLGFVDAYVMYKNLL